MSSKTTTLIPWSVSDELEPGSQFGTHFALTTDDVIVSFLHNESYEKALKYLEEHASMFQLSSPQAPITSSPHELLDSLGPYHLEATLQGQAPDSAGLEVNWPPEVEDRRVTSAKEMRFNVSLHALQDTMFSQDRHSPELQSGPERKLTEFRAWPKDKKIGAYEL